MAEKKVKGKKLAITDVGAVAEEKDSLRKLLMHIEENPMIYVAAVAFVVLCFVAGILVRVNSRVSDVAVMTQYAKAMEKEDPKQKLAALSEVAAKNSRWTAEALYLKAETAIRAQELATAEEAFNQVLSSFPTSEYAPRAKEGLAFLAENKGNLDAALAAYTEVKDKWPNTFEARRQSINIARVLESKGDLKAAIEAYQAQVTGFPDSHAATKAEAALKRLQSAHPDLFPKKEEAAKTEGEVAKAEGEAAKTEGEVAKAEGEAPKTEGEAAKAEGEVAKAEGEAVPQPAPAPAPDAANAPQ